MQEFQVGAAQHREVTPVGIHVVRLDIGNHGHHGLEVQEGGIALVCLGYQETTGSQLRITADAVDQAADDKGRVQARLGEHRRNKAGGRGLAVGTGNRDPVPIAHQFRQHLGPRHHRHAPGPGGHHFGVVLVHRTGADHHIRRADILPAMANEYPDAPGFQARGYRAGSNIGARNFIAQVGEHLGNAAHAGAAYTYHMDAADAAHFGHGVSAFLNCHG